MDKLLQQLEGYRPRKSGWEVCAESVASLPLVGVAEKLLSRVAITAAVYLSSWAASAYASFLRALGERGKLID